MPTVVDPLPLMLSLCYPTTFIQYGPRLRGDGDSCACWHNIKTRFPIRIPKERLSRRSAREEERGIWQRRLFKYTIRDEDDLQRHIDYVPQSDQTWPCTVPHQLDVFELSPVCKSGTVSTALGSV